MYNNYNTMNILAVNSVNNKKILTFCRCCLTHGCYKDISTEYYYSGDKEVYEEMLKDTFNIQIMHHETEESLRTRLICEDCIRRLRDAHAFKQMVVQNELNFKQYLEGLHDEEKICNDSKPEDDLKQDSIKVEELNVGDFLMNYDDQNEVKDEDSFDDDEILANIKLEMAKTENTTNKKRKRKVKRKLKICDSENEGKVQRRSNSKSDKDWMKITERRGNGPLLRENSLKLISNSTLCVFQWNKSRYRCFCCKEPFSDMNSLREHTNSDHNIKEIEKKIIIQQNRLVKVEISVLFCKICGSHLENLNSLRSHLKTHNINFELDEDLLVPFKIDVNNLQCQICSQSFAMFRLLNIHMNKHFQKQVCHICGAGFSNLVFLSLHKSRSHRPLNCKECNIIFNSKTDKRDHDVNVHNLKFERKLRFPCPYCQERFFQENFRVQHLVEKHGMKKPEYNCTICSKVFITRSLCNNHMKNVHLKEKNHECDLCHHLFYSKSDVSRHRVTHTREKKFACTLCSNLFATKDSVRRHMKRTHVGACN